MKYAYYLNVRHDGNPRVAERKPVDAPVLRALAEHAGMRHVEFRHQPSEDGLHLCAVIITKPASPHAHEVVTQSREAASMIMEKIQKA